MPKPPLRSGFATPAGGVICKIKNWMCESEFKKLISLAMTIFKEKTRAFIILLATLSLSGCATALTSEKISPGDEKRSDYVTDIIAAYRDKTDNIIICVSGRPAGANYWLLGDQIYTLNYPASSSPNLEVLYHKSIPQYLITAKDVQSRCPEELNDLIVLPILTLHARDFGNEDYSDMSEEALIEFFKTRAKAPAIYKFHYEVTWASTPSHLFNIVYVSDKPIHGKVNAVEITTRSRKVKGKPVYALLLPFAIVFDVVTFPVQLLLMLTYD
jgi:uncharacterized protein YceK